MKLQVPEIWVIYGKLKQGARVAVAEPRKNKINYLHPVNTDYIDQLLQRYLKDPLSIDESWRYFFEGLELGSEALKKSGPAGNGHSGNGNGNGSNGAVALATSSPKTTQSLDLSSEAKVADLINAYRERGRILAHLNPLEPPATQHPMLDLQRFELTQRDLERTFTAGKLVGMGPSKLSDIITTLRQTYCRTVGVEYTHIQDPVARGWVTERLESSRSYENLSASDKTRLLFRLAQVKNFEHFLHTRYVAQKRFSLEGSESLIPALDRIIEVAAESGTNQIVMGMAHRGRLNVLHHIFGKEAKYIFTEFEEEYQRDETDTAAGDVKYHMGFSSNVTTRNGKPVHLSLAHNPSHLEAVDPVVIGICRAKQRDLGDVVERKLVIPVLIHGDAAFSGQGVIYETLNLSQLVGYRVGGTIHIVIDNQIGFTTSPSDGRSTQFSTDIAKMLEVPIFHVNGDDPEAVWFVARMATEYRQTFKKDVFIDLISYRKYGHNEGDEPSFTQPLMYKAIKSHASTKEIYAKKLIEEKVISEDEFKKIDDDINHTLLEEQKTTREKKPRPISSSYQDKWKGLRAAASADMFRPVPTAVNSEILLRLAKNAFQVPSSFNVHPKLQKLLAERLQSVVDGKGIDWGTGELLAYASLLCEGHTIRMTGQDVERGTFSHRHAVLNDFETGVKYNTLNHLGESQGEFIIANSSLSEMGVLGFEYGWSLADPMALVIWEAQFGDFANSAQVIIDQFISSSESKWKRASGIVLLLPHGYEGQGPEHSSARLERFLQLCGNNNLAVCNFTTPAQIFHALRRQIKRDFRKPMVVMTPKSLLRHPFAVSTTEDFTRGHFQEVLDDVHYSTPEQKAKVTRVLLCSGKVYYDILEEKTKRAIDTIAILRVEQLYPWPEEVLAQLLSQYPAAKEIFWVQEEPRNMGGWLYVFANWSGGLGQFENLVGNRSLKYIGRDVYAAPAVGSKRVHSAEQEAIVEKSLRQ